MIGFISSMVGVFVFLVGVVWAVLQWASKPMGQQVIKAVDAVTPGELAKYMSVVSQPVSPNRLEALGHADALMVYFEKTKNKSGQDAIKPLVAAIFQQGEVK